MHHQDIDAPGLLGGPRPDLVFRHARYDRIGGGTLWHLWAGRTAKQPPHWGYLILWQQRQ